MLYKTTIPMQFELEKQSPPSVVGRNIVVMLDLKKER
jgi:hypothetical protein